MCASRQPPQNKSPIETNGKLLSMGTLQRILLLSCDCHSVERLKKKSVIDVTPFHSQGQTDSSQF